MANYKEMAKGYLNIAKDRDCTSNQRSDLSDALEYMISNDILQQFPCPACSDESLLGIIIIHLNDDHKWRRCETDPGDGPTITEWLDELEKSGYDLTVKFTIEGEKNE